MNDEPLYPGQLRVRASERARDALATGALEPIATDQITLEDRGVRFLVRMISSLMRKEMERRRRLAAPPEEGAASRSVNPFLPYDSRLCVGGISETHVALLNKFPVMDQHLLIVTRQFEDQERLLTRADFQAWWSVLAEMNGLGFYNGGAEAGASQPHKHLQAVPLPFMPEGPAIPMQPALRELPARGSVGIVPGLPFRHAIVPWDEGVFAQPADGATRAHDWYQALMRTAGMPSGPEGRQGAPYNLLVTREWMLLVVRARENFQGISVNALGFAGSLFVRDQDQLNLLARHRPFQVLTDVCG